MPFGIAGRTMMLGIAAIAVIFAVNPRHPAVIALAELQIDDLRANARPALQPTGSVAIVEVDDKSIAKVGRWPWPRAVMADLISTLRDYKVAVIGMDLIFDELDDFDRDHKALAAKLGAAGVRAPVVAAALGPGNDAALADALVRQGSTYLAYPFEGHYFGTVGIPEVGHFFVREISNPPPLTFDEVLHSAGPLPELISANAYLPATQLINSSARGSAFVDVDADMDGVLRTIPTVIRFHDRFCAPLFLALVGAYRDHHRWCCRSRNRASVELSSAGRTCRWTRWDGCDRFPRSRHRDPGIVGGRHLNRRTPEEALKGKIVMLGVSARGLGDRTVTSLGADIPGVEVQAGAVDNVLSGRFLRRSEVTEGETRLIAILLGFAMTIAVSQLGALRSAAVGIALVPGTFCTRSIACKSAAR